MRSHLSALLAVLLSLAAMWAPASAAPPAIYNLGTLGGGYSAGLAINDSGQVTGNSETGDDFGSTHAFRYTGAPGIDGVMHDLGTLGGIGLAYDINDSGQVVGSSGNHAFLYTGTPGVDGHMIDLDVWLDANNPVEGAKWTLTDALGVNNNGLITGRGLYNDGTGGLSDGGHFAFLLDASSLLVVPEPTNVALFALAVPAMLSRGRFPRI